MVGTALLILFLISILVQIIYFIIFSHALKNYSCQEQISTEPVSVVIAAHDEEENLKRLIPELLKQQHSSFELVVVDDRSNDDTYDYLMEQSKTDNRLRVVKVDNVPDHLNGKKYALTLGIKAAKNDLILLTDADCTPRSDQWIGHMAQGLNNGYEINLGVSLYESKPGFLNYFIRFETILTIIQYVGLALKGYPYMGVGRNLAYRKHLFLRNKGFNGHQRITGGDDDLFVNEHATKKNTNVTLGNGSATISIPKDSWSSFFRQKLRHLSVGKLYSTKSKIILSIFSLTYIFSWLILLVLLVMRIELYVVLGSFFIRTLLVHLTFIIACKKLDVKWNLWGLILIDIVYVHYYIITGITALFTKRVRWN